MSCSDRPIMVSISCLTFNHAPYIRECLDGFLMQKTDFAFEVLIHDDASTDGTDTIIREYEAKYPDIIKPIYETENQWNKGRRGSEVFNFPRACGKYIALCEGDDYWIDPLKLQKQVDYMEAHPECSLCFHSAKIVGDDLPDNPDYDLEERIYSADEVYDKWIVPTASVMFRSCYMDGIEKSPRFVFNDIVFVLSMTKYGYLYCMKDAMSVYRRMGLGLSVTIWDASSALSKRWLLSCLEIKKRFKKISRPLANRKIVRSMIDYSRALGKEGKKIKSLAVLLAMFIRYPFTLSSIAINKVRQ